MTLNFINKLVNKDKIQQDLEDDEREMDDNSNSKNYTQIVNKIAKNVQIKIIAKTFIKPNSRLKNKILRNTINKSILKSRNLVLSLSKKENKYSRSYNSFGKKGRRSVQESHNSLNDISKSKNEGTAEETLYDPKKNRMKKMMILKPKSKLSRHFQKLLLKNAQMKKYRRYDDFVKENNEDLISESSFEESKRQKNSLSPQSRTNISPEAKRRRSSIAPMIQLGRLGFRMSIAGESGNNKQVNTKYGKININ